jgi:hypothetical protein
MTWNWVFSSNQRARIGLALGVVLLIIIIANWFVGYTMQQVDNQFKSVYQDRLVPASYMTEILERSYQNQLLLERHLQTQQTDEKNAIRSLWLTNKAVVADVVQKFETTYITDQEAVFLKEFKNSLLELEQTQKQLLALSDQRNQAGALQLYQTFNQQNFQHFLVPLHNIIKLQEEVGHELYLSADRQVKSLKVISYIVIAIAVFIALIIGTLLQTSHKLNSIKYQNYKLN